MRASGEPPTAYGRYENIFLSKDEYDELQAEYPDRLERLIEEMSHYLAASGKAYQNYAAALHRWAALYAMPKYRLCLPIMSVFVTFDKILSVLRLLFS